MRSLTERFRAWSSTVSRPTIRPISLSVGCWCAIAVICTATPQVDRRPCVCTLRHKGGYVRGTRKPQHDRSCHLPACGATSVTYDIPVALAHPNSL